MTDSPWMIVRAHDRVTLLALAFEVCSTPNRKQQVLQLLTTYDGFFSCSESDVGMTNLIEHAIPTAPGTVSFWQPCQRLCLEKKRKVQEQVQSMVQQRLVEPGGAA